MFKIMIPIAFTLMGMLCFAGVALAENYVVPLTVDGNMYTVTVTVDGKLTDLTGSPGVKVGKPQVIPDPKIQSGYWTEIYPDALDLVNVSEDKFREVSFYNPVPQIPKGAKIEPGIYLLPYVGKASSDIYLRLGVMIRTDERITSAMKPVSIIFLVNGKRFDLDMVQFGEFTSTGQDLTADVPLDSSLLEIINAIALSKSSDVQVIFGSNGSIIPLEKETYKWEKEAIGIALAAYEMLGGQPTVNESGVSTQPVAIKIANLRSGPGTDYKIMGKVEANTVLVITGQNADGTWLRLDSGFWIAASLVKGAPANLPIVK